MCCCALCSILRNQILNKNSHTKTQNTIGFCLFLCIPLKCWASHLSRSLCLHGKALKVSEHTIFMLCCCCVGFSSIKRIIAAGLKISCAVACRPTIYTNQTKEDVPGIYPDLHKKASPKSLDLILRCYLCGITYIKSLFAAGCWVVWEQIKSAFGKYVRSIWRVSHLSIDARGTD